jgi:hypothetical protein
LLFIFTLLDTFSIKARVIKRHHKSQGKVCISLNMIALHDVFNPKSLSTKSSKQK